MGEKNCATCEFSGRPSYKSPCANCRQTYMGRSNWTERQKKQTNADRIRAMTDDEMARYFAGQPDTCPGKDATCNGQTCVECWTDWLGQEAEDSAPQTKGDKIRESMNRRIHNENRPDYLFGHTEGGGEDRQTR